MFTSMWEAQLLSVTRIVAGFMFLCHVLQKSVGMFGGLGGHAAAVASTMGAAGILETIGGAMLILGLFTRPTAFVLSGQMAVAFFLVHFPMGFLPLLNGGD